MRFEAELRFFRGLMGQMRLPVRVVPAGRGALPDIDLGLREKLGSGDFTYSYIDRFFNDFFQQGVIYRITDEFSCRYAVLQLPVEAGGELLVVGPYVTEEIDGDWLREFALRNSIHREWLPLLTEYFQKVTFLRGDSALSVGLSTLADTLWGVQHYRVEHISAGVPEVWLPLASRPDRGDQEDVVADIRNIEQRYEAENRLIQMVCQGRSMKAEQMLSNFSELALEKRTAEPGRNIKNYSIILNTVLRKAVEQGGVHPLYIDRLSSEFAFRIERIRGWEEVPALWRDMAHKYCLLVNRHSINRYSPMVQKVIARVDFDLSADLSLKGNADALNVNASYLSSMFKNEMGVTLTEYVNRKRMEHAIFLLSTTKLTISAVGQRCGIQDDNYFTKIFKKHTGVTPKQFRQKNLQHLRSSPDQK